MRRRRRGTLPERTASATSPRVWKSWTVSSVSGSTTAPKSRCSRRFSARARTNHGQLLHQDRQRPRGASPLRRDRGVVTWIALDETDVSNGCMQFVKGSHKRREEFAHLRADVPTDLSDHPDLFEAAMSPATSRSSGRQRFTGPAPTTTVRHAVDSTASTSASRLQGHQGHEEG